MLNVDQNYFFYPENLSEKALFFGWTGINLVIIAVGLVLSTLIFFFSFVSIASFSVWSSPYTE